MKLDIFVERSGGPLLAGSLDTQPGVGEGFTYSEQWLSLPSPHPLSLSLPLQEERFSARQVRPYFEGLLPEGRPRAAAARELHLPASSYAKILAALGWECIGART
ncbi:HipA N-terminal domain-containing protein [Adlercreutzia wanghongyangiae]|uniref:HipA N-terminal domain-containing protein n=1 Tax=Adlercreutzia wanghongyangiae TaxID=3111451 RepID=UPI003743DE13